MKFIFLLVFFIITLIPTSAQIVVNPTVVYHGLNQISISSPAGIKSILRYDGGLIFSSWKELKSGFENKDFKIGQLPIISNCNKQIKFIVQCKALSYDTKLKIKIISCNNTSIIYDLNLAGVWNVYKEEYGNVELGSTKCHIFEVFAQGEKVRLDSIISPSPLFKIKYTNIKPPVIIQPRTKYTYEVCYTPTKIGRFKCPILTYIHREQPSGGFTNFIVSDTGYATVVLPKNKIITPPQPLAINKRKPIVQKPKITFSKPKINDIKNNNSFFNKTPKNVKSKDFTVLKKKEKIFSYSNPKIVSINTVKNLNSIKNGNDSLRFNNSLTKYLTSGYLLTTNKNFKPINETSLNFKEQIDYNFSFKDFRIYDPTTFRMMLSPTANSIGKSKLSIGNYDVLGWIAQYGLDSNLTLIGAGLFLPRTSINQFTLVGTIGLKNEFYNQNLYRFSGGLQTGITLSDSSTILLGVPYVVSTFGNEDQRINFVLGYSIRHHDRFNNDKFYRYSPIVSIGGDFRFIDNFKIIFRTALFDNLNTKPFVLSFRYFGLNYSIDAALGVNFDNNNKINFAPILNGFYVF